MTKKVSVTKAQKTAANFILARSARSGLDVSSSLEKIAKAESPAPAGGQ